MAKRLSDTRLIMGMPVTVETVDDGRSQLLCQLFGFFEAVDEQFSTYKPDSEVSRWNRGLIGPAQFSAALREVLDLAERTRAESNGFFDINRPDGKVDPSGIVKGWAVHRAAKMLRESAVTNFYVEAGGDIECAGLNADGEAWRVGIRNPFDESQIIAALALRNCGIATSGTYVRGQHIYNPFEPDRAIADIVSLTVIGPDVLEADRMATAAFAMGGEGIYFIERLAGLEGYMIGADGMATQTTGYGSYVLS